MSSLVSAVRTLISDLTNLNIKYAFVGALAIGARGKARQTIDADIAISTDTNASIEKFLDDLVLKGYGINNLYKNGEKIALARLFSKESSNALIELDFLFNLSGIEKEVVDSAHDRTSEYLRKINRWNSLY